MWIYDSFQSVDLATKTIDLRSGIAFPVLQTLACLEFREKDKKFTESEVTDIMAFSSLCPNVATLKYVVLVSAKCLWLLPKSRPIMSRDMSDL